MEKVIKVDIVNEEDVVHKFNSDVISKELINYIISQSAPYVRGEEIKIVITKKCKIKKDIKNMIVRGFEREYIESFINHFHYNKVQISFLILGIVFLFLSSKAGDEFVWRELLLIGGWVPIWETIHLEIVEDVRRRKRRKLLRRLLKSEIIE